MVLKVASTVTKNIITMHKWNLGVFINLLTPFLLLLLFREVNGGIRIKSIELAKNVEQFQLCTSLNSNIFHFSSMNTNCNSERTQANIAYTRRATHDMHRTTPPPWHNHQTVIWANQLQAVLFYIYSFYNHELHMKWKINIHRQYLVSCKEAWLEKSNYRNVQKMCLLICFMLGA